MWLERQLNLIRSSSGPVVLEASRDWGASFIIQSLGMVEAPLVWVELAPEDRHDPVAQGNALSEAVARGLGTPLFGKGLPYSYGIAILKRYLDLVGPFTFAVTRGDHGIDFCQRLFALHRGDNRVLVTVNACPPALASGEGVRVLGRETLRLTQEECSQVAGGGLPARELRDLWNTTGGAFELVLKEVHRRLSLPPAFRPTATGLEMIEDSQLSFDPGALLAALKVRERWPEALELAIAVAPEQVPHLIDKAGHHYFESGLFQRFWNALDLLPPEALEVEGVLYWKFVAAVAVNKHRSLIPTVRRFLDNHEAPELRSAFAGCLPGATSLTQARRAFQALRSPDTLRNYASLLGTFGTSDRGLALAIEAVERADSLGQGHLVVKSGIVASVLLSLRGEYVRSREWASWSLNQYYQRNLSEELARLWSLASLGYSMMLTGDVLGLQTLLADIDLPEEMIGIPTMDSVASTLGDWRFIQGDYEGALGYYLQIWEQLGPYIPVACLPNLAATLCQLGRAEQAFELVSLTRARVEGSTDYERYVVELSMGTCLAAMGSEAARDHFAAALHGFSQLTNAPHIAQAGIGLAVWHLQQGNTTDARRALDGSSVGLRELGSSGWKLFGGPDDQHREVRQLWLGDRTPLHLSFLGHQRVRRDGTVEDLGIRWCEVLALLAAHPQGLTSERLSHLVYGELGNLTTIRATVSKIRRTIPIRARPYRFDCDVSADFLSLMEHLEAGKVREALQLHSGPLLPESQAPGVIEIREDLEESLRQAVLLSNDVRAIQQLATQLAEDLELWEAALRLLSANDPQFPIVRARVNRIRTGWMNDP